MQRAELPDEVYFEQEDEYEFSGSEPHDQTEDKRKKRKRAEVLDSIEVQPESKKSKPPMKHRAKNHFIIAPEGYTQKEKKEYLHGYRSGYHSGMLGRTRGRYQGKPKPYIAGYEVGSARGLANTTIKEREYNQGKRDGGAHQAYISGGKTGYAGKTKEELYSQGKSEDYISGYFFKKETYQPKKRKDSYKDEEHIGQEETPATSTTSTSTTTPTTSIPTIPTEGFENRQFISPNAPASQVGLFGSRERAALADTTEAANLLLILGYQGVNKRI